MSDYMQGDPDGVSSAIPFSDDEKEKETGEDLLAEDSPTASPEERITRQKKRSERIKTLLDDGKQSKAEVSRLKEEQAALRNELAELRGRVNQPQVAPPTDGKSRWDRELDAVYEMQTEAYNSAQAEIKAGTWTDERQRHYEKIAREVESRKTRIHTEQALEGERFRQRQESARQVWVNKYPEVYRDPRAHQYAEATFKRRLALGEPETADLVDDVMQETLTTFKLGPKKAPSASDKARMSGVPSSGGGGSSSSPGGIKMTPEFRRMAIAAYSELPEAEAIKKWVNTTGKRLREKKLL